MELSETAQAFFDFNTSEAANEVITAAGASLTGWNGELAENVSAIGVRIAEGYRTVENICLRLLLRQQPVATDLRVISAVMKMITDMERIGDHCTNIAEWVESSVTGVHRDCQ